MDGRLGSLCSSVAGLVWAQQEREQERAINPVTSQFTTRLKLHPNLENNLDMSVIPSHWFICAGKPQYWHWPHLLIFLSFFLFFSCYVFVSELHTAHRFVQPPKKKKFLKHITAKTCLWIGPPFHTHWIKTWSCAGERIVVGFSRREDC